MCESIGHRPLRGRCPAPSLNLNHNLLQQGTGTADHLTLLRLFQLRTRNSVGGFVRRPSVILSVGPPRMSRKV